MRIKYKLPKDRTKVYYIASPYSHKSKRMMNRRYLAVDKAAAKLCLSGFLLIEPISMCHYKSLKFDMPTGYEYWKNRDRKFVSMCDGILILTIPGWDTSTGVKDEVAYAQVLGKEVIYLDPKKFLDTSELSVL